jgi:hypothetical protein
MVLTNSGTTFFIVVLLSVFWIQTVYSNQVDSHNGNVPGDQEETVNRLRTGARNPRRRTTTRNNDNHFERKLPDTDFNDYWERMLPAEEPMSMTNAPTRRPSDAPTQRPSQFLPLPASPSSRPTSPPTAPPTRRPTTGPTRSPSQSPTSSPSSSPSGRPTPAPSASPSGLPSGRPSHAPSRMPSSAPSARPSSAPTRRPTSQPTTSEPTMLPSAGPSSSMAPTAKAKKVKKREDFFPQYMSQDTIAQLWSTGNFDGGDGQQLSTEFKRVFGIDDNEIGETARTEGLPFGIPDILPDFPDNAEIVAQDAFGTINPGLPLYPAADP